MRANVRVRARRRVPPASTAQVYAGVHDRRFRLDVLTPPGRFAHFAWDRRADGSDSWIANGVIGRSKRFSPNVVAIWTQGAYRSSIQVRVTVRPDRTLEGGLAEQARDVEARALKVAENVRTRLERALGCALSAPAPVGVPKHSVLGSHAAKALRRAGIARAPDGPEGWGADDTPEADTAEIADAKDVAPFVRGDRFVADPLAKGRELERIDEALRDLAGQVRANVALSRATAEGLASLSPLVRQAVLRAESVAAGLAARERAAAASGPAGEWGAGRAA